MLRALVVENGGYLIVSRGSPGSFLSAITILSHSLGEVWSELIQTDDKENNFGPETLLETINDVLYGLQ